MSVTDVLVSLGLLAFCVVVGYMLGTTLRWFTRTSRRFKWIFILTVGPAVVLLTFAAAIAIGWWISSEVTSDSVRLAVRIVSVPFALCFISYGVTRKRRDRAGRRRRVIKPAGTHVVPPETAESRAPATRLIAPSLSRPPSPLPPPAPGGLPHPAPVVTPPPAPAPVVAPLPTPMLSGNRDPDTPESADPEVPRLPPRATPPTQFAPPRPQ